MNVSTLEQMESDWNQPVRRVQLVWEELSLTAKLQQLLKTWGHLVMDQGRTPGSQKMLLRLSCQFPGAQHFTWGIVSDRSLLPNISICK